MNIEKTEQSAQAIWDELDQEESGKAPSKDAAPTEPAAKPVEPDQPATEAKADDESVQPEQEPVSETPSAEPTALDKRLDELTHLVKSTAGRVGALQSELTKIGQTAAKGVSEAPSQSAIATAAKTPEKWARMKEDFPEWAEAVESLVGTVAQPKAGDSDAVVELRKEIQAIHQQAYEDAKDIVSDIDPQWEEKVRSPEFAAWLKTKPEDEQQRIAQSVRPRVVLNAIKSFEADRKAAADRAAKNKSRVAAAAMPSGNSPTPRKNVDDMSEAEYWAYLDEQDKKAQAA